jgi:hypothetical protein
MNDLFLFSAPPFLRERIECFSALKDGVAGMKVIKKGAFVLIQARFVLKDSR